MSAVLVQRDGGVLVVTLNRPEVHNAIDRAVSDGIARALQSAEADTDVRAVVITGAGGRAFSAGADLRAVSRGEDIAPPDGEFANWGLAGTARRITKPVIAAVEGIAYGGGFEIALTADILVAGASARFALPEVKVGLIAGAGGAVRLRQQLPSKIALHLLLTGDSITADTAASFGLVSRVVDDGEALADALAIAHVIAANAPLAVAATKQVALGMQDGFVHAEAHGWELNDRLFPAILASHDAREGARAFAEKRAAQWSGT